MKNHFMLLILFACLAILIVSSLAGCSFAISKTDIDGNSTDISNSTDIIYNEDIPTASPLKTVDKASAPKLSKRDNTPLVLIPVADGSTFFYNIARTSLIDASNSSEGYIMATYVGDNHKVKLQITGPNQITYTYNLNDNYEVFPLTSGNGQYTFSIYENIAGEQYSTALSEKMDVNIYNEFGPYLYPNQYVNFNSHSDAVQLASDIVADVDSDLSAISAIYNYVSTNITYDYEKAKYVQSGYLPIVDEVLTSKTGICFDYAAIMATMLRSQGIPTRLEVGYAGDAYHAWISVYITDIGWINGIIEFDGKDWTIMDPTFAASSSEQEVKDFIGDGHNYMTKYVY